MATLRDDRHEPGAALLGECRAAYNASVRFVPTPGGLGLMFLALFFFGWWQVLSVS